MITVFLDYDGVAEHVSAAAMMHETARLVAAAGIRIDWRLLSENSGTESYQRIAVIRFRGACRPAANEHELAGGNRHAALGFAEVDAGKVLPFGEVFCDRLRELLGVVGEHEYGRALGRVVAHELYHIVTGTVKHDGHGVAKPLHTREELRAPCHGFAGWAKSRLAAAASEGKPQTEVHLPR